MNEKNKNVLLWAFIGLVFLLSMAASAGVGYHVRDIKAREDNNNVRTTIQQLKSSVRDLDTQLRTAREELSRGQIANSQAQGTVEDIARRNEQSKQLIDDSRARLSEIERQFADIDRANNLAGADE